MPAWLREYATTSEIAEEYGIPESLRGWNLQPGIDYLNYLPTGIALTDCPSGRIAYLHLTGRIAYKATLWSARGNIIHEIMHQQYLKVFGSPDRTVEEIIYEEARRSGIDAHRLASLCNYHALSIMFDNFFKKLKESGLVVRSEVELDGKSIGMSAIRADLIVQNPPVILDLKTHKQRGRSIRRHYLQITAYALAYESMTNTPVDIGAILEITECSSSAELRAVPFHISGDLRREVSKLVRQKANVCRQLEPEDPGLSDEEHCRSCYFRDACWETEE